MSHLDISGHRQRAAVRLISVLPYTFFRRWSMKGYELF
jgi:hypothetical protein